MTQRGMETESMRDTTDGRKKNDRHKNLTRTNRRPMKDTGEQTKGQRYERHREGCIRDAHKNNARETKT